MPLTAASVLPASPPLDPSAPEARDWLARELSSPAYTDDRSWLERLLAWLGDHLDGVTGPGPTPTWVLPTVLVVLALVVAGVVLLTVRRAPRLNRADAGSGGVLDDALLTASAYRARAEAALSRGDAATACADAFRALAASASERTLLEDVPARTAHEIGTALSGVFPVEGPAVRHAADLFDRVVYGHVPVEVADARGVLDLDARLRASRPVLAAVAEDVPAGAGTAR